MDHDVDGDIEAQVIDICLNPTLIEVHKNRVEPLDRELGKPSDPFIEKDPTLELKTLHYLLKYDYLVSNNIFPTIIYLELSKIHVQVVVSIL